MSNTWEAIITSPSLVRKKWLPTELAVGEVLAFERRFGDKHLKLACHAALPLILTPELLNLIRINFLEQEQIPWVAEVDFLLSPLCRPIGEEIYEVEPSIREVLLVELENQFSWERPLELAEFLQFYLTHNFDVQQHEEVIRTQRWIAEAYIDPDRVVEELRDLRKSSLSQPDRLLAISEQVQLATTLEILAEPLEATNNQQEYQYLVHDARVLAELLYGDTSELKESELSETEATLLSPVLCKWLSKETRFLQPPETQPPETRFLKETGDLPTPQTFKFDVATVELKQVGRRKKPQVTIIRSQHQAQYFTENLPNNVTLEMVSIPGGTFRMGSPETEVERYDSEGPQHEVTVSPFFMGKYPITQAQWRVVAGLPQVDRELDPDPSGFKGDNLPVESISWYDAVEFCDRLSTYSKRTYRLPSEAEWEYACRAGTTTPFHFGETITTELANYNGDRTYGSGPKGKYRQETTPVGNFEIANAFGIYDMHGNVWEWCADNWHDTYEGAPKDSSIWLNDNDNRKLLRGGSWYFNPMSCRSACRNLVVPGRNDGFGFRVVVPGART